MLNLHGALQALLPALDELIRRQDAVNPTGRPG